MDDGDDGSRRSAPSAELVAYLESIGVPRDTIPSTTDDVAHLASEAVLGRRDTMTLAQLCAEADLDIEFVGNALQHLGIRVEPDAVMFNDDDTELARFVTAAVTLLTESDGEATDGEEVLHVAGTSLASLAAAAISGHVQGPERRVADPLENAQLNALMSEIGLDLGRHLGAAFRHHLRQSAQRQKRTQSVDSREVLHLTIGFVDLVGFTALSQKLDPDRIVALITHFESNAYELAHEADVQVVKMIGDEVMFVAEQPASAARFALGMLEAFAPSDVVPRGGLATGALVAVHGDYFGPVVNLAARLVDTAVPGEILIDTEVATTCGIESSPAGRRLLKGFPEPLPVFSLAVL